MTHERPNAATERHERIADRCVRDVCELPDLTSPHDQPDLISVSYDELRSIIIGALDEAAEERRRADALAEDHDEMVRSEARDDGANYVLTSLAAVFGRDGFDIHNGSETWEGDVHATLIALLNTCGVTFEGEPVSHDDIRAENARLREALSFLQSEPARFSRFYPDAAWRPIETAPRDGVPILACGTQKFDAASPPEIFIDTVVWSGGRWQDGTIADQPNLTHWMPLPEPPQETGGGE